MGYKHQIDAGPNLNSASASKSHPAYNYGTGGDVVVLVLNKLNKKVDVTRVPGRRRWIRRRCTLYWTSHLPIVNIKKA